MSYLTIGGLAAALVAAAPMAQISVVPHRVQDYALDSGYLHNPTAQEAELFRGVVRVMGSDWLRVEFGDTNLPAGSRLRLTSLDDGAVQWFDAASLRDYRGGSAYFNGEAVEVVLLGAPRSRANRFEVVRVVAGEGLPLEPDTICGSTDDRQPSSDPRQGRQWPTGCTAWLINATTVLTAGHCTGSSAQQIHFNVPMSSSGGSLRLPPPAEQFAYDMRTLRRLAGGTGADWAVVSTVRNSNHRLYPGQWTGQWYQIGAVPAPGAGARIRITGYGQTSSGVPSSWNQIQKTHVGELVGRTGTRLEYTADTSGGNSGSPVIHEDTGKAVGIHTHGGCSASGGFNIGTRIDRPDLAAAIAAVRNLRRAGLYTPIGNGCAGSIGTPTLSSATFPDAGADMTIDMANVRPNQIGVLFFGGSGTTWMGTPLPIPLDGLGLSGCTQYVSFDVAVALSTGALGQPSYTFRIPNAPDLAGRQFFNQYVSGDPGANPVGVTLTNAAVGSLGN